MRQTTTRDLVRGSGTALGATDWVLIEQSRVDGFATVTDDHQWIHTDPERAGSGPFGGTVAHGYLTLSLVSKFLGELIQVTDASTALNYGLDRVRFPAPVPVGSRIRGHGRVLKVSKLEDGVQTTTRITIECDAGQKPVAVADVVTRFLRD